MQKNNLSKLERVFVVLGAMIALIVIVFRFTVTRILVPAALTLYGLGILAVRAHKARAAKKLEG